MSHFIERLKAKPEHVRRRIALGTTFGITGVIAVVWFFTLLFAGTLSLAVPAGGVSSTGTLAQANTTDGSNASLAAVNASGAMAPPESNWSKLLGAVGVSTAPAPAPALKVEDAVPVSTSSQQENQPTVIPF